VPKITVVIRGTLLRFLVATVFLIATPAYSAPVVVVSINPLHLLTASIMRGSSGKLRLLVEASVSPHHYALRPSDARALSGAGLVIWTGPELESFLVKPITALVKGRSLALLRQPGITVYARRSHQNGHSHDPGPRDPHIWLDPLNVIAMAHVIADALIELDPKQKQIYATNLAQVEQRLNAVHQMILRKTGPVKDRPFAVTHDAFQYFEKRYELKRAIYLSFVPAVLPSAKRLSEVRAQIAQHDVRCVFSEPQLSVTWLPVLSEGRAVRTGALDPLGLNLHAERNGIDSLLLNVTNTIVGCLSQDQ